MKLVPIVWILFSLVWCIAFGLHYIRRRRAEGLFIKGDGDYQPPARPIPLVPPLQNLPNRLTADDIVKRAAAFVPNDGDMRNPTESDAQTALASPASRCQLNRATPHPRA